MVDEEDCNWDLLLHYMLFTVWLIPQTSTSFTPFKLLSRQRARGLLDIAKVSWEDQSVLFHTVLTYVRDLQDWIKRVAPIIKGAHAGGSEKTTSLQPTSAAPGVPARGQSDPPSTQQHLQVSSLLGRPLHHHRESKPSKLLPAVAG